MGEGTPKLATIPLHPCQHKQWSEMHAKEYQYMDYEYHMKNLSDIL